MITSLSVYLPGIFPVIPFLISSLLLFSLLCREVAEPAITVKNLPKDITEKAISDLYSLYKPVRITLTHTEEGAEAVLVLGGPADVALAVSAMSR